MRTVPMLLLALVLASCGASDPPPAPPAPVHHLVLITLTDPAGTADLLRACAELGALPGALQASAGGPLGTGRAEATTEWHVAFHVAFPTEQAYGAWREHPRHLAIAALWKPRFAAFRVVDWLETMR